MICVMTNMRVVLVASSMFFVEMTKSNINSAKGFTESEQKPFVHIYFGIAHRATAPNVNLNERDEDAFQDNT